MADFDPDSITEEKSLWAILWNAHKLPGSWFNRICLIVAAISLGFYTFKSKQTPHDFAELTRSLANVGLGFAGTILGFLVAGFTIFATLSKPSLMSAMARTTDPETGLSYLKSNFGVFYLTFGWYLGFCGYCVVVLVFGPVAGPISELISALPSGMASALNCFVPRASVFITGIWLIILMLELKSFMYNLYHVIMTTIQWEIEFEKPSEK